MIYDNSTGDTFHQFYEDDPLGFLTNRKIDTEKAKEKYKNGVTVQDIENMVRSF